MKKIRIIIFILTIVQAGFLIFAVIMQTTSSDSSEKATFEILALVSSAISIAVAAIAQLDSYKDRKETVRIVQELNEIDAELDAERSLDKTLRKKLDELTNLDRRIYRRLLKETSNKKDKK